MSIKYQKKLNYQNKNMCSAKYMTERVKTNHTLGESVSKSYVQ